eukprot:scaffold65406_cov16-Tisochrysis_lutea.AAC.2
MPQAQLIRRLEGPQEACLQKVLPSSCKPYAALPCLLSMTQSIKHAPLNLKANPGHMQRLKGHASIAGHHCRAGCTFSWRGLMSNGQGHRKTGKLNAQITLGMRTLSSFQKPDHLKVDG